MLHRLSRKATWGGFVRRRAAEPILKKMARRVAAIHYRNRSDSFQSRQRVSEGGNAKLQIEGVRRGAVARQEARADSGSRSSCRRIDSQGVDPRSLNWKISSPGKARDRNPRLSLQRLDRRRGGSSGSGPCWRRRLRGCLILGRSGIGAGLTLAGGSALLTTCDAAGLTRRT
jgi:hypothetical protein